MGLKSFCLKWLCLSAQKTAQQVAVLPAIACIMSRGLQLIVFLMLGAPLQVLGDAEHCYGKDFKGKCYNWKTGLWSEEACDGPEEVSRGQKPNDGLCSSYGRPGQAYSCCGCKTGGTLCGCCSHDGKADDVNALAWPDSVTSHSAYLV